MGPAVRTCRGHGLSAKRQKIEHRDVDEGGAVHKKPSGHVRRSAFRKQRRGRAPKDHQTASPPRFIMAEMGRIMTTRSVTFSASSKRMMVLSDRFERVSVSRKQRELTRNRVGATRSERRFG